MPRSEELEWLGQKAFPFEKTGVSSVYRERLLCVHIRNDGKTFSHPFSPCLSPGGNAQEGAFFFRAYQNLPTVVHGSGREFFEGRDGPDSAASA